ncbi:FtsX-like permease family protein [Curtobacterium sp. AB7]|uniref:FtsX-like permease family protein n=1 Tax=Curtobacterium sp. AB7 TaxID=3349327 RepID=UPI003838D2C3
MTMIATAQSSSLATSVLAELASVEARTITVQGALEDQLPSSTLAVLDGVDGVESAVASGPATDVTNRAIPGGAAVPSRRIWTCNWSQLGLPEPPRGDADASAFASKDAVALLGIGSLPATVVNGSGSTNTVVGHLDPSRAAASGLTGLVVPTPDSRPGNVTRIVVVARSAEHVASLARVMRAALPSDPSPTVRIRTSDTVAQLSSFIGIQLDSFSRSLILSAIVGSGMLVAIVQAGLVLLQRKDFGRRRALGASRLMIIALIAGHTLAASATGAALGGIMTIIGLRFSELSVPPGELALAFAAILVTVTVGLALIPAAVASNLDPASEMRSP